MEGRDALRAMHATLDQRKRPEDVAALVVDVLGSDLRPGERDLLQRATKHAKGWQWGWSSMSEGFLEPVGMERQFETAAALFPGLETPDPDGEAATERALSYITAASRRIAKTPGRNDFKADRLDRAGRKAAGLGELSKRQYNKRFRLLARMERKRMRMIREWRKRALQQVSKTRMGSRVTWEDFSTDVPTACFVAYYAARCNLRSVFSGDGQASPYDEISDMLFQRCRARPATTNWWAVAHIHPTPEVLAQLDDERKGELLGMWFGTLEEIADFLREVWNGSEIDAKTMIVRRGNDSSTWNTMAGAWNKARDGWINTVYALGMEAMLDRVCFGKVLRLMAADVAAWHRSLGKGLDPDTNVWNALPFPWEVLAGNATCTRPLIETVCRQHGVDPFKKGWTGPRPQGDVEPFTPTPELVHGVAVASPRLAQALKRAGWFSGGRTATPAGHGVDPEDVFVFRDEHGFAQQVEDVHTLGEKLDEAEDPRTGQG